MGNLTDEERKILDGSISELQANFAETVLGKDEGKVENENVATEKADNENSGKEGDN